MSSSLDDMKSSAIDAAEIPKESQTTYVPFFRRVLAQKQGRIGLALTAFVVLLAFCGPLLLPWATGSTATEFVAKPFSPYGLFGTDNLGRSVLSRFLAGGFTLIIYSVLATALGMVLGAAVGMLAAYVGGRFDAIIMRLNDVLLAIPQLVFALLAITVLGPQGWVLITVIGITHAPRIARVARSATLNVINEDYILAAEMYAMPRTKLLVRELLPNITGPLSVEAGLRLTYSIGAIASLSFLGLGLQPPAADWGLMINENRIALSIQPWGVLLPVIAIALLTIGTNLLADSFARATASTTVEE
ncbi:ABC transporter permease [Brevibacterium casei]|uniref:ABC-type dipeptide/oligopeptide/nickel transport system, permease component n=1 Tax=Brevibacterium casei S18 TaxID=1229781 RepID=K9AN64_9MICO|nr:ABC transporter permease [Brevibacterium casei]EKU48769.1 ABC-type dipeptide/oligopeptide/nickel transport system, permease component [Brevibacterium casei S18]MCT1765199.1 ABC transporter permease [Brevibacterium casei]MCT2181472.1 ABC transporter permease [Brevibacterium casei]MCT2357492.1 ABC transporter permease [Brevibacterium casei]MDH5147723.1 ABC transporter permease [Brevibacterium casei]